MMTVFALGSVYIAIFGNFFRIDVELSARFSQAKQQKPTVINSKYGGQDYPYYAEVQFGIKQ